MKIEMPSGVASAVYELEMRERRFRAVFESATDAIVIFDDSDAVLEANRAAATLFGVAPQTLVGRSLDSFHADAPGRPLSIELRSAGRLRREFEIVRPDGERRVVESSLAANFVLGQHVGVLRDVTDQRAQERERQQLESRVDVSEQHRIEMELRHTQRLEAIGRLAAGIAHEFNNLLAVIGGFAALLETSVGENADARDSVHEIKRATNRAARLVHGLLAFSKQEPFDSVALDLHALIRHTAGALQELFGPQVELDVRLQASARFVQSDALQLEHVLQQLAANARDAMPDGGRFTIETSDAEDGVQLVVRDTGTGMDAVTRERAFEPFFTTKPLGAGTGLGLSRVYGIVARSGGRIAIESEPGNGTLVRMVLPAADRVPADEPVEQTLPLPDWRPVVGTETVMLVEHDTSLALLIESFLTRLGYRVMHCPTEADALKAAAAEGARLDLAMFVSNHGRATSDRKIVADLRQANSALPVLLIGQPGPAASSEDPLVNAAILSRPFAMAELASAARRLLDRV